MSDSIQTKRRRTDPQTILCDMCIEDRKPAKKTCMKCEISMCVQHLQAHLTTPVLLQTHPLTEPMALCGNTKCSQHGKLLEYYCLDDMTCVCVSCAIEDQHRLHNMKTFSTAHKELLEKLKAEQLILQEKTDDENVSLEKWEKSEREKLGRCSVRLIEAVTKLRDISLTSVQSSVSARMVSLKTSKSSMEAAQKEKDTFRFLQMYSQVHQDVEKAKAVDLSKGLEPGSHRDKLVEKMRQNGEKMVKQASQFWGSLLTLVDPEHHQELVPTGSHLIFEPQSLGPGMSLSKDNRKVFHNSWLGQCCATLLICSTKTASSFQRWVVSLSEESDWTIGLCDKKCAKNLKDGAVYGLCWEDKQLSSLTTKRNEGSQSSTSQGLKVQNTGTAKTGTQLVTTSASITYQGENGEDPVPQPEKVEVLWNFTASTLSFFSRTGQHQREEIITMKLKASVSNRDLAPFVQLGKQNIHSTTQQQQWKCSCGKDYYWDGNRYRDHSSGSYYQGCCSCGKVLGPHITEMVCELY
ncbi:tripartite motif-containing protein 34 isoform X4 [Simochromis diagramma]|uniref:tripartite motif-containing protein 34 isoform X4 n=1 Tax=Simochromis diagramma TaxID=43689 RepID=UPI001A7E8090|nr:tripartite motif-containing protein 34 isoform X4 [Simochromis diagramma]